MLESYLPKEILELNREKLSLLNKIVGKHIIIATTNEMQRDILNVAMFNELKSLGHSIIVAQTACTFANQPNLAKCTFSNITCFQKNSFCRALHDQFICHLTNDTDAEFAMDVLIFSYKHAGSIINIQAESPLAALHKIYQLIVWPRTTAASTASEVLIKLLICQCVDYIVFLTKNHFVIYSRNDQEFSQGSNFNSCYSKMTPPT